MAKKAKDAAQAYLAELGVLAAKNMQEVRAKMVAALGEEEAKTLWRLLHQHRTEEIYARMDGGLEESLALSDAIDGDLLRKICHWLSYHKSLVGKTLLDVGCGNGIVTCFLASQLPGVQITGIDRRSAAVAQAQALAQRLGLTNVTFRQGEGAELTGERYATLMVCRTLGENLKGNPGEAVCHEMQLLNTQANCTAVAAASYAAGLCSLLEEGGTLISFEQGGRSPQLLGWLYALSQAGFAVEERYQKELLCQGADKEKTALAITVAQRGTPLTDEQIYDLFTRPYQEELKQKSYVMTGEVAGIYLQAALGELVEGYQIYFPDGTLAGRMALWTDRRDPAVLLNEQQAVGSKPQLFLSLTEKQEAELTAMRGDVKHYLRRGVTVRCLTYRDGKEGETALPEDWSANPTGDSV